MVGCRFAVLLTAQRSPPHRGIKAPKESKEGGRGPVQIAPICIAAVAVWLIQSTDSNGRLTALSYHVSDRY